MFSNFLSGQGEGGLKKFSLAVKRVEAIRPSGNIIRDALALERCLLNGKVAALLKGDPENSEAFLKMAYEELMQYRFPPGKQRYWWQRMKEAQESLLSVHGLTPTAQI